MNRRNEVVLVIAGAASLGAILLIRKNSNKSAGSSPVASSGGSSSALPPQYQPQGNAYPTGTGFHLYFNAYGGTYDVINQTVIFTAQALAIPAAGGQGTGVANQQVTITLNGPMGNVSKALTTASNGLVSIDYPSGTTKVTSPGTIQATATWTDPNGQTHTATTAVNMLTQSQYQQLYG